MEKENQERELQHVVERNKVEDESSEVVEDIEGAEDDPVSEPLFLLLRVLLVESEERLEGGVGDADQTRDVAGADAEDHHCTQDCERVAEDLRFIQSGCFLDLLHSLSKFAKLNYTLQLHIFGFN